MRISPYLIVCLLGMSLLFACSEPAETHSHEHDAPMSAEKAPEKLLRHVVMFKFKDEASEADVAKVVAAFEALPSKIPQIYDFEWGTDNSPEGLQDGFTHCFFLSFLSEEDRAAYLPHPDHKAFGAVLGPHLDKVLVVDYWN